MDLVWGFCKLFDLVNERIKARAFLVFVDVTLAKIYLVEESVSGETCLHYDIIALVK